MRKIHLVLGAMSWLLLASAPGHAGTVTDITMLPPTGFTPGTGCGSNQILVYSGSPSTSGIAGINCINGLTGTTAGDITVPRNGGIGGALTVVGAFSAGSETINGASTINGTESISGALNVGGTATLYGTANIGSLIVNSNSTIYGSENVSGNITSGGALYAYQLILGGNSPLDYNSATAVLNLEGASCLTNQALTRNASGAIYCVAVTDLLGVGTTTVPSCPSSYQLYFNGSGFSCIPVQAAPVPPYCAGNQVLQYNGSNFVCTPISSVSSGAGGNGSACSPAVINSFIQNWNGATDYTTTYPWAVDFCVLKGYGNGSGGYGYNAWTKATIPDAYIFKISGVSENMYCAGTACAAELQCQNGSIFIISDSIPQCNATTAEISAEGSGADASAAGADSGE